jgi:hypothetical protein
MAPRGGFTAGRKAVESPSCGTSASLPQSEQVWETEMKTIILSVMVLCVLATDSIASTKRESDPDRTLNGRALGTLSGQPQRVIYFPTLFGPWHSGRQPTAYERQQLNIYRSEHGDKHN